MEIILFFTAAFAVGMLTPWQTAVNGNLRVRLRSPYLAAGVNCITGCLILSLLLLITGADLSVPLSHLSALPWWYYSSGPLGAAILVISLVLLPRLGFVGSTAAIMTGMLVSGLICDHAALFGLARHPFDLYRAGGLTLALIGVACCLQLPAFLRLHTGRFSPALMLFFILGMLSGTCSTVQAAVNAQMRAALHSMLFTALFSMFITALLALSSAAACGHSPRRFKALRFKGQLHNYTGGLCGAASIAGSALLVQQIGAGALMTLVIAGQLCCSMLMDHCAAFGLKRRPFTAGKLLGLVLIIAGLCLIRLL